MIKAFDGMLFSTNSSDGCVEEKRLQLALNTDRTIACFIRLIFSSRSNICNVIYNQVIGFAFGFLNNERESLKVAITGDDGTESDAETKRKLFIDFISFIHSFC